MEAIEIARSRTTFAPGNKAAVRHGALSLEVIQPGAEALAVRIKAGVEALPYTQDVDEPIVDTYSFISEQIRLRQDYYKRVGGMFTKRGTARKGSDLYDRLVRRQGELAKVLALGATARASMMQAAAGANKDLAKVRAGLDSLHRELAHA